MDSSSDPGSNHVQLANNLKEMLKINQSMASKPLEIEPIMDDLSDHNNSIESDPEPPNIMGESTCLASKRLVYSRSYLLALRYHFSSQKKYVFEDLESVSQDTIKVSAIDSSPKDDTSAQQIDLNDVSDGDYIPLQSDNIVITSSLNTELDSTTPASNKVKISTITKFEWEHRYYSGNLISCTDKYTAYSIKGRTAYSVRVINRENSSDRVLLKGFEGQVCDVSFNNSNDNILAAVDDHGNLIVWALSQIDGKMVEEKKLHLRYDHDEDDDVDEMGIEQSPSRVIWIPHVNTNEGGGSSEDTHLANTIVLSHGKSVEVWNLSSAFKVAEISEDKIVTRSQLSNSYATIEKYDDDISDCELAPVGNVLAAASYDGFVKFWQINLDDEEEEVATPQCLHRWKPHDGKPVSSLKFCDNKKQPETNVYWRFLLTGSDRNNEIKMWCTVSWSCLQTISFLPPTPGHALPELNLVINKTAEYVVLSDVRRKVLYVLTCQTNIDDGVAKLTSLTPYQLTAPILSLSFIEAFPCKFKCDLGVEEAINVGMNFHLRGSQFSDDDEKETNELEDDDYNEDGNSGDVSSNQDGFLIKLVSVQPKHLSSLDVRLIPKTTDAEPDEEEEEIPDTGITFNTYKRMEKEIKDEIARSLHNSTTSDIEEDIVVSSNNNDNYLNTSATVETPPPSIMHTDDAIVSVPSINGDDVRSVTSGNNDPAPPPDVTSDIKRNDSIHSDVTPILLTPDAFLKKMKSAPTSSVLDTSANTSAFTNVTPFNTSNNVSGNFAGTSSGNFNYADDVDVLSTVRTSLSSLGLQSPSQSIIDVTTADVITTSHNVTSPVASTTSEGQQTYRASQVNAGGPDLISSTSSNIENEPVTEQLNVAGSNPTPSTSFIQQSPSSWPKAPDVTIARSSISSTRSPPRSPTTSRVPPVDMYPVTSQPVDVVSTQQQQNNEQLIQQLTTLLNDHNEAQQRLINSNKEELTRMVSDNMLRINQDFQSLQNNVTEATCAKVERSIKNDIKRVVLPGLIGSLDGFKEQLGNIMTQKVQASNAVWKDTITKTMQSKDMLDSIANATTSALQVQLQQQFPDILFKTVIPAFERSCQNMLLQLSNTYSKGIDQVCSKLEKQLQYRLKPEQDKLQGLLKETYECCNQLKHTTCNVVQNEISKTIQNTLPQQMDKVFAKCEERISVNFQEIIKKEFAQQQVVMRDVIKAQITQATSEMAAASSSTVTPPSGSGDGRSILPQPSVQEMQNSILKSLQQGNINTAFQTALTAANVDLVMYVCEAVDPSVVFGVTPCPLQQAILLSLIQQLSSADLDQKTEIKLKYLQEAVMNLDRSHQVTREYLHTVLSALVEKLSQAKTQKSFIKDIRMLSMAAQSLMK